MDGVEGLGGCRAGRGDVGLDWGIWMEDFMLWELLYGIEFGWFYLNEENTLMQKSVIYLALALIFFRFFLSLRILFFLHFSRIFIRP